MSKRVGPGDRKSIVDKRRHAMLDRRRAALQSLERRRAERGRSAAGSQRRGGASFVAGCAVGALTMSLLNPCAGPAPSPPPCQEASDSVATEAVVDEAAAESPPDVDRLHRQPRPDFPTPIPDEVQWLSSYQLQVAARSPRIAACFEGTEGPIDLRWTATIDPQTGRVTERELVPTLPARGLTAREKDCTLQALSDPEYSLDFGTAAPESRRISIVLEL